MLVRIIIILIILNLFPKGIKAQTADTLTMEQAVEIALQKYPRMEAARLKVEKEQKLKKTAFELDNTKLQYSRGQLDGKMTDYSWQFSQGFRFPTTYISRAKLQEQMIQLRERGLSLTASETEYAVRSAFMNLTYTQEQLRLFTELEKTYADFAEVAEKRYQAGETNFLEKTYANSYYQQVLLKKQQAEAEAAIYRQQLQQYLKTGQNWIVSKSAFKKLKPPVADSGVVAESPVLQYYEKATDVAGQQYNLEQSGFLPDFSVGYIHQQMGGVPGLNAIQLGVAVPLFFWAQQGKVQAAGIDMEIAQAEYDNQLRSAFTAYQGKLQEYQKYQQQVEYYERQGLKTADELMRFSVKSYRAGEIDYLEFTRNIEQSIEIKMAFMENLNRYNQVIIDLQYLTGSFNH